MKSKGVPPVLHWDAPLIILGEDQVNLAGRAAISPPGVLGLLAWSPCTTGRMAKQGMALIFFRSLSLKLQGI